MQILVTNGVKISVQTRFQQTLFDGEALQHLFAYKILIENHNEFPIQLMNRYWQIFDSNGHTSEVSGEGVVGETPIIDPQGHFEYVSGCNLSSDMGSMKGHYEFINLQNLQVFKVEIPLFILITPEKLN